MTDNKYLTLIGKIAEKTQQGRIAWRLTEKDLTASIPGKLDLSFVRNPSHFQGLTREWALFTMREPRGKEIFQISGSRPAVNPVIEALDRLYRMIVAGFSREVEEATQIIDSI
jgi:hypothetical protein